MKAWILKQVGSPYVIEAGEVDTPVPAAGEVRIRVRAISLNPVDYKFAKFGDTLKLPHVLGIDAAGEIDAVGSGVTHLKVGDRVACLMNLRRWGAFAEYAVANAAVVSRIPDVLSFEDASTIPCAGITAWQALYEKFNLKAGVSVLITAGGGGVGSFAIQLAKAAGARVFATASQDLDWVKALGADVVIDYKNENPVEQVMAETGGKGIDCVVDLVSADSAQSLIPALRHNGHLVCVAGRVEQNPTPAWAKSISLHEVALAFAYQHGDDANLADIARGGEFLAGLMARGTIKPNITRRICFDAIPEALLALEARHVKGKIVASVG